MTTILSPDGGQVGDEPRRKFAGLGHGLFAAVISPLATILVASFVIYIALSLAPGDPVAQILGTKATPEQRAIVSHELGLDKPVIVRYTDWLFGLFHGDLGTSLAYRGTPVSELIVPRLATTFLLVLLAGLIILVLWLPMGAIGGSSERFRPIVSVIGGLGIAIPGYVGAIVLISVFAVSLGWFPTFGAGSGLLDRLWHLVLPAIALSVGWGAYVALLTSAAVRQEASRDHVSTAIGRGLSRRVVFRRHVLRNAAIPVLTVSGLTVAGLVAGTVVVEYAFGIDGIGSLLVKSVELKDYPVVTPIALIMVTAFVAVTTALDLTQSRLDPRIRDEQEVT